MILVVIKRCLQTCGVLEMFYVHWLKLERIGFCSFRIILLLLVYFTSAHEFKCVRVFLVFANFLTCE